jgi:hypothetical protein
MCLLLLLLLLTLPLYMYVGSEDSSRSRLHPAHALHACSVGTCKQQLAPAVPTTIST